MLGAARSISLEYFSSGRRRVAGRLGALDLVREDIRELVFVR